MHQAHVFTYGSLMYPDIFERVTGRLPQCYPAVLNDWRRHALKEVSYPGAVPQAGHVIRGMLWHDLTDAELMRLDAFESSEYRRNSVLVTVESGLVWPAQIYVWLDPDRLEPNDWPQSDFEKYHRPQFFETHRPR